MRCCILSRLGEEAGGDTDFVGIGELGVEKEVDLDVLRVTEEHFKVKHDDYELIEHQTAISYSSKRSEKCQIITTDT
jgi:hypothetical protein